MNTKHYSLLMIATCFFLNFSNASFGESFVNQPISHEHQGIEKSSLSDFIQSIKSSDKYLVKQRSDCFEVHLYTDDTYQKSYVLPSNSLYTLYSYDMINEQKDYEQAGFTQIPSLHISNTQNYTWFETQYNTGRHASSNCGPTCVEMVLTWLTESNQISASYLRDAFIPNGGWASVLDIADMLQVYNVDYVIRSTHTPDDLLSELDDGSIALACVNTDYWSYNSSVREKIGVSYTNTGGHFIIITGYLINEKGLFFEIYDPAESRSFNDIPLGQARYIDASELMLSVCEWWDKTFIIKPSWESTIDAIPVQ